MSYRWVVATPNGKIIAWIVGPCNSCGNSLQAEGMGMLSVTIFLSLLSECPNKGPLTVTFDFDNEELINRCDAYL